MKPERMKRLTVILPVFSLLVSAGIVTHQHYRRDRLNQEYLATKREFSRLQMLLPASARPAGHDDDGHDHRDD